MVPVITDTQKAELNERGYTIFPNVFTSEEMAEVAARIESYQKRHEEELARNGAQGISRASEITFTTHLAENDAQIEAFVRRPEFVYIASELLGPDTDLYWNQAVFKMPEGEKEFPWHQDDGYTPVTPSPYLTLWLALNDATPENGCVSVLPGSHKQGVVPHYSSPIGLVCHDADDPDQGIPVPVSAGSIAAFWSTTMHKSGVNRSTGSRKAYIIQYSVAGLKHAQTGEVLTGKIPLSRAGVAAI